MPKVKLTEMAVARFKAPPGSRIEYFDATLPGFGLRVAGPTAKTPGGRKSWVLFYRFGGVQKRLTLEPLYPALGLAKARKSAGDALALLAAGKDPGAAKAARKAETARAPDTVATVVDLFMRRHMEGKKHAPRYIAETRRNFDNHVLPRWAKRDIKTITRRDVIELLDAIMDGGSAVKGADGKRRQMPGGPVAANRVLAAVRAMFNFALRRGLMDASPAALVERPGNETARARTLSADELRTLWPAFGALGFPFAPFLKLCLLTGQRRGEVAGMRWADLDLVGSTWTLAAAATKNARGHIVPLSPLAVRLLAALPRKAVREGGRTKPSPFVFTTTGTTPICGFSRAKQQLDAAVALEPWTIHDIRRTVATELGRLGVSRLIISKVLNHTDRGVTGIYDRHTYLQEKRAALESWAQFLEALTRPTGAHIVPIREAAND